MRKENITMLQSIKMCYDKAGPRVVEALRRNHFDAYYFSNREEAVEKIMELIPAEDTVSWGGTATVDELGIKDLLRQRGQALLDRDTAKDASERMSIMRQGLLADTFLMSSNAITEEGELYNIDGNGNRVAALCFGPKSVIVVAGMNKVVADMDAAYSRVRHLAAPANAQRFAGLKTPCAVTGQCGNCRSTDCICAYLVATRVSRPAGKIKVILIGENLGI